MMIVSSVLYYQTLLNVITMGRIYFSSKLESTSGIVNTEAQKNEDFLAHRPVHF